MKFNLTFGRNSLLIWALIIPSFALLIPLLLVIEYVIPEFPNSIDLIVLLTVIFYIGFDILITLAWVKAITPQVNIILNPNSIEFSFGKNNILHPSNFVLQLNEIKNVSKDFDKGYDFIYFDTHHTAYSSFFIRSKEDNPEFEKFSKELLKCKDEFNQNRVESIQITDKSMYQKWPMKTIAFVFMACWVVFPIIICLTEFTWIMMTKYIVFVIISSPIVYKVYSKNYHKFILKFKAGK